jgi:hypothetical protein
MWSGWGIRTLSERNPAFNPFSYQNGSVWPHDNGIIAMGCKRYGFAEEAAMIARDISEAGRYFLFNRLPELYAGTQRGRGTFPVQYLGANVPQARAAGSVFLFFAPSWDWMPRRPKTRCTSIPCCRPGCRISRSASSGSARRRSTFAFGGKEPLPAMRCLPRKASYGWNRGRPDSRDENNRSTMEARGMRQGSRPSPDRRKVLVIDVGGTSVKILATGKRMLRKVPSGPAMTAQTMVEMVKQLSADWSYDVISLGYPGAVSNGRPVVNLRTSLPDGWGLISRRRSAVRSR